MKYCLVLLVLLKGMRVEGNNKVNDKTHSNSEIFRDITVNDVYVTSVVSKRKRGMRANS